MSNKKKKESLKYIFLFMLTVILMLGCIILIVKIISPKMNKNVIGNFQDEQQVIEPEEELSNEDEIKNMSETSRMKRYVGIFFENIEEGNYEQAYNVLNKDFKSTYFPTLDEFKEYAKKYFDFSTIGVTYENIERLGNNKTGNMYVLWLTIENLLELKKTEEDYQNTPRTNFVIIENDYNNYEMSFSVINEE